MRKLLKYEMRALNRRLFPLYGGVLAMAVLNYFFGIRSLVVTVEKGKPIDDIFFANEFVRLLYSIFQACIVALFFGLIVAMFVIWLLTVINRFRKGLLGEEGYLMFTLPVSTGRLIGAKMLGASIHMLLVTVVCFLAICTMIGLPDVLQAIVRTDWGDLFAALTHEMPSWPLIILEWVLIMIAGLFTSVLQFYLAMALGHLSNSHRTLLSVLAYIGISIALNMVTGVLVALLNLGDFEKFFEEFVVHNISVSIHLSMLMLLMLTFLKGAVMWFGTCYILKNKLNLE